MKRWDVQPQISCPFVVSTSGTFLPFGFFPHQRLYSDSSESLNARLKDNEAKPLSEEPPSLCIPSSPYKFQSFFTLTIDQFKP